MATIKMVPLTKDEVSLLITLVEGHAEVTSRATSASNNADKQKAWKKIAIQFNANVTTGPRKPEQLRLKWENLKKAARKRSAMRRMNSLKGDSDPSDFFPPDNALDRVASILEATQSRASMLEAACEGYSNPFGEDSSQEVVYIRPPKVPEVVEVENPIKKIDFSNASATAAKLKHSINKEYLKSRTARNLAIAEYYNLKKVKVELEIQKLKNENEKLSCSTNKNN